jgi:hypothetical protein
LTKAFPEAHFPYPEETTIMRTLLTVFLCLVLSACAGTPNSGDESGGVLAAPDGSFSLKFPAGWSVRQKGGGEDGRVCVLAHKDAISSGKGYPTLVVREVPGPTPQGVLDFMARDKNLDFSELWSVSPQKYRLQQVLLDNTSKVLVYWLAPRDGQDLEYYAAVVLTGFGRVEMIGVAQAGTIPRYMKDFNAMFAGLDLAEKARFTQSTADSAGDAGVSLRKTYASALEREREGLKRQAAETSSWAASGAGLTVQEKGFLANAYVRAADKSLAACAGLIDAVNRYRSQETANEAQRLLERLDEAATALETIQLNIGENQARSSVEKSAARARRMVELGREALKLPQ